MVKYRPIRSSTSASIKEEETFHTVNEMLASLYAYFERIAKYIGLVHPISITVADPEIADPRTGWKFERGVYLNNYCVGYCGE